MKTGPSRARLLPNPPAVQGVPGPKRGPQPTMKWPVPTRLPNLSERHPKCYRAQAASLLLRISELPAPSGPVSPLHRRAIAACLTLLLLGAQCPFAGWLAAGPCCLRDACRACFAFASFA